MIKGLLEKEFVKKKIPLISAVKLKIDAYYPRAYVVYTLKAEKNTQEREV